MARKAVARPALARPALIDARVRAGTYPNASSLARELEVHPRTVHRDLEFLRDSLKAPLEYRPRHNGYRDPDFTLPAARLTPEELVALVLAERRLQPYRGTPHAGLLAALFAKLTAGLPGEVSIDLGHLAEAYSVRGHVPAAGDAGRFARLARAVREGRRLELVYWTASRDAVSRRVVDPYHLASVDAFAR